MSDFSKFLALDLGEKRIGVALSDGLKMIAQAHEVFARTSRKADFAHVKTLVEAHQVSRVVVGLPISLDGSEGAMAQWARDYGRALGESLGLPVVFWDESFTSEMATKSMAAHGYSRKKMKGKLDAVAAALILQSYLDSDVWRATGDE